MNLYKVVKNSRLYVIDNKSGNKVSKENYTIVDNEIVLIDVIGQPTMLEFSGAGRNLTVCREDGECWDLVTVTDPIKYTRHTLKSSSPPIIIYDGTVKRFPDGKFKLQPGESLIVPSIDSKIVTDLTAEFYINTNRFGVFETEVKVPK